MEPRHAMLSIGSRESEEIPLLGCESLKRFSYSGPLTLHDGECGV